MKQVLGVYEWSGSNPLPPELWLLPYILPFHPGRMWCHCRMVYLPMSYLYGRRFVCRINGTILSLRRELYTVPYHHIDWDTTRNQCAKVKPICFNCLLLDFGAFIHKCRRICTIHIQRFKRSCGVVWRNWESLFLGDGHFLSWETGLFIQWCSTFGMKTKTATIFVSVLSTRYIVDIASSQWSSDYYFCWDHVVFGIGLKVLNMVCCWVDAPDSEAFKCHLSRIKDYLWVAEDGMKMQVPSQSCFSFLFTFQMYNNVYLGIQWISAVGCDLSGPSNLGDEFGRWVWPDA